jgi:hypothetical protein
MLAGVDATGEHGPPPASLNSVVEEPCRVKLSVAGVVDTVNASGWVTFDPTEVAGKVLLREYWRRVLLSIE